MGPPGVRTAPPRQPYRSAPMTDATGRTGDSPRRLLVTGATGFIGRQLVRTALREGFDVRALVRDRTGASGLGRAELFTGDLVEPDSLDGIEAGVDALNPIEPTSGMDMAAIKKRYGKNLVLIGNVDANVMVVPDKANMLDKCPFIYSSYLKVEHYDMISL